MAEKEAKGQKYNFGCLMLQINPNSIPHYATLLGAFKPADLYESETPGEFGIEFDPHVTVLFGFHDDATAAYPSRVMKAATTQPSASAIIVNLTGVSCFKNEKYDVVKFDVKSPGLVKLNKAFASKFEHTNEYDYHPHLTLAYVQPGKGDEYAKKLWDIVSTDGKQVRLTGTRLMYSRPSGEKIIKPL